MLKRKVNESLVEYGWRMHNAYENENYKLSIMVDELMHKHGDDHISMPDDYDFVDTLDGLKWFKITDVDTAGLIDTKEYAIIWVSFNIYNSPKDAKDGIAEKEGRREFGDLPRKMQLFILRELDIIYNN